MINTFNEKPNFPITYGDTNIENEKRLSDYVVTVANNRRVQNHLGAVVIAAFTLGMYAQAASAIPAEYGEAASEILNQGGGAPAVPPIGDIRGQVPLPQANPQFHSPAMPVEQQRILAAQQSGQLGATPGMPGGPGITREGPTSTSSFYLPGKPQLTSSRAINTAAFTTALGVICLNAVWGEPVAIIMCSSGLVSLAYSLGKEVVLFMAKNMK